MMLVDLSLTAPPGADEASTTTAPPVPRMPTPEESSEVTAGLGGFLVVFALGLALWFLGRDLTRRMRRMNNAEKLRHEQAAASEAAASRDPRDRPAAGERAGQQRDPLA